MLSLLTCIPAICLAIIEGFLGTCVPFNGHFHLGNAVGWVSIHLGIHTINQIKTYLLGNTNPQNTSFKII